MLTKSFYMYIITILICMGLWTICTLLPYWYASGCYEPSYVDRVLIPVDRGFLVNGYSYRVVGYLFLTDWCLVRLFLDCCNTVFRSPDLSVGYWLYCYLFYLRLICRLRSLSFAAFTLRRSLRLVFLSLCPGYVLYYVSVAVAGFPWIPFSCVLLHCLVWTETDSLSRALSMDENWHAGDSMVINPYTSV